MCALDAAFATKLFKAQSLRLGYRMCFSRRSLLHDCLGFRRQQSGVRLFNVVNEEICHVATEVLSDDDA